MRRALPILRSAALVLALALLGACGSDSATGVYADLPDAGTDSGVPDTGATDVSITPEEVGPEDTGLDFALPDLPGDTGGIGEVDVGGFGEWNKPCDSNADCESGYCVQVTENEWVCTITCVEECPKDWQCKGIQDGGPDMAFICVPPSAKLCNECETDADCVFDKDRCLPVGDTGSYCTIDCANEQQCPEDFTCMEIDIAGENKPIHQCFPDTGSCVCTPDLDGTTKECSIENDAGKCYGDQLCDGPKGWSDCSAAVPVAEECDGIDNDCNGQIDEGLEPKPCMNISEFGTCQGIDTCQGLDGWVCDADEAGAEECDGVDNNCNDVVDEGYPDTDSDGLMDCIDLDDDADGILDETDNCPLLSNPVQADLDGDGFGDKCDPDDDGDGVLDELDNCPSAANVTQEDFDGDGLGDECDGDIDGDGVVNAADCAPYDPLIYPASPEVCDGIDNNCNLFVDEGYPDADGDSAADCVDADDHTHNDPYSTDSDPLDPLFAHGQEVCGDGVDNDCDGNIDEGFDDTDLDGIADCVDKDSDGDGIDDFQDNCPQIANPGQMNSDNDALGDACDTDDDNDNVPDDEDNCPIDPNQDQADLDEDKLGDPCDPDADGDGTPNEADCAFLDPAIYPGAPEACNGLDDNCNSQVDEGHPDSDGDNLADCIDPDDDGDGDPDESDCEPLNPEVYNGAPEICDAADSNCDGSADEGCPAANLRFRQVTAVVDGFNPSLKARIVLGAPAGSVVEDPVQGLRLRWGAW